MEISSSTPAPKRLGYWISAKKSKKLSLSDIEDALNDRNIETVRVDLSSSLLGQVPLNGFLHKLTDVIAKADQGDPQARALLSNFEAYGKNNPKVVMIDPISSIRTLINRYETYRKIQECDFETKETVFVPPFVILESENCDISTLLRNSGVEYPVVCKPVMAHGSASAHEMTLVFNERGLSQCHYPIVVQSFVNHNAVLYKLFAIGEESYAVKRPSIINLFPSESIEPIHFHSDEISKPESSCHLTSPGPQELPVIVPCPEALKSISKGVHKKFKIGLFGVDVVVEHLTGRYAIVDINVFPGYDGVPDFPDRIACYIRKELDKAEINDDLASKLKSSKT